jgi:hypothetical protein
MHIEPYRTQTQTQKAYVAHWDNITTADTCAPLQSAQYTDKSVQVFGTFGVGGTATLQGSNDGTNWATLTDPQGNPLSMTSAKIEMVSEATVFVRPVVTGDGSTSITVLLLAKE